MIKIDFLNNNGMELVSKFCEYFCLNKDETNKYFSSENPDRITPNKFVHDFKLDLNKYCSENIKIRCRHMTTVAEKDVDSFRLMGLLDLRSMLQLETPLSSFLSEYGIHVDVDNKILTLNDISYPITSHGESCKHCIRNKIEKCTGYAKCEFRKKMDHLGLKLYQYGATVEFFIYSSFEQMALYSSIRRHPEILVTLENVVEKAKIKYSPPLNLGYEWMKRNEKCYVLEFEVKLSDMETFAPMDWQAGYEKCNDCLKLSGYTYNDYIAKKIPQRILDNVIFLQWFFSIYFYGSKVLGSLLPSYTVPSDKITYIEIEN